MKLVMRKTLVSERESSFSQLFHEIDVLQNDEIILIRGGRRDLEETSINNGNGCGTSTVNNGVGCSC